MLIVISPAKTLDYETPPVTDVHTTPDFLEHSQELIEQLRDLSPAQIGKLMGVSDKISGLNAARFEAWNIPFTPENAKQAVLAFKGDVYTGLDAESLDKKGFDFAQKHLRILSGLYGLLRPLDLMQAYRLEMGTKFANQRGKDLYTFWGEIITGALNAELAAQKDNVLINLASNEYFKSVKLRQLDADIITPVFKDLKNGQYKIISFYAKKARGLMTRYIIDKKITQPADLKSFNYGGYEFNAELSNSKDWVFTRDEAQ
ncbi:peroxide stress protein YaaA [Sansalvadorimonas verongulae]|uniref:peroxide stress protein YaaA n=1 Tax=Sansalvadorimonas verongulae TaxID=2172824 RepID=UPI002E331349|nr:peroxide stress protein YaaA [Sansalvadorimonas verongulae]MTI12730.1 peroxide stress protein YaaA [Sansalvadorimonas verongulae]